MDEKINREIIGRTGLDMLPESIRNSLTDDQALLSQFGLQRTSEGTINVGDDLQFRIRDLRSAICEAETMARTVTLRDVQSREWEVAIHCDESDQPSIRLVRETDRVDITEGAILSRDQEVRQKVFRSMADQAGMPPDACHKWESILLDHIPTDVEFIQLHEDLDDTPCRFVRRLSAALRSGETLLDLFIPERARYYERLIGKLDGSRSASEHARRGARARAQELVAWRAHDGVLLSLALASHSEMSSIIPFGELSSEQLVRSLVVVSECGDMISRIGAIEGALAFCGDDPSLRAVLEKLVEDVIREILKPGEGGFSDLSRLFIFVDSELSRRGILRDTLPFYRRMASFAQASLIQRQIAIDGCDPADFRAYIDATALPQFYSQSLVDMRVAPRWYPDLADAEQLRQEFIGRLIGAGGKFEAILGTGRLFELLSPESTHENNVHQIGDFPRPFFPGPLEGESASPQALSGELLQEVEKQLADPEFSTKSFVAIINAANVFSIDPAIVSRVTEIIRQNRYHLLSSDNPDELKAMVTGLAKIAGFFQNADLAEDAGILVNRHWGFVAPKLSVMEAIRALFFAAAAHPEIKDWCCFLGRFLERLAFGELTKEEARELRNVIRHTCAIEPELWTTIGGADAALDSILQS